MTAGRLGGGSEKVWLDGDAGRLEGLWLPAGNAALERAVVLCHPHPLFGGTMETKLVARAARRLSESGFQTLRFNFRGVGRSEGEWSGGREERADVRAAVDYAATRLSDADLAMFGFSFGALVGLEVGAEDARIQALVGVAPPVGHLPAGLLTDCLKPTLIVGAGKDELIDPKALADWVQGFQGAIDFESIEDADHLFTGRTDRVAECVARFLDRYLPAGD